MNPQEETQSLKNDPLPLEGVPDDEKLLPTQIALIDELIERKRDAINAFSMPIEEEIRQLVVRREQKLQEAIQKDIIDDGVYFIDRRIWEPQQRVNTLAFRNTYPAEYLRLIRLKAENLIQKGNDLLDAETLYDETRGVSVLKLLPPGQEPPTTFSQADLKVVLTGKGAPAKIMAVMHRPGESTITYEVKKKSTPGDEH